MHIRERDCWGETKKLRKKGQPIHSRWHWVYTGTVFRLDQRDETTSGLKRRKDGALDVINSLHEIRASPDGLTRSQHESLDEQIGYFDRHKDRMDYKHGKALDQPLGSGAMESTCAQYQCRFKRTGQFWSLEGDEAFLALQTLHWNGRWHLALPAR